ncbi:hypothetical protein OV450_4364 [Actinobacteria bacterium OV450]|nr:hypothetical protein OV450_4364 [Actinobacteria bacterium OV450]
MFASLGFGPFIPVLFVLLVVCVAGGAIRKKRHSRPAGDD